MKNTSTVSPTTLVQCDRCIEWVRVERLSDHRIWAHNVGGAIGVGYFKDSTGRQDSWEQQIRGTR